MSGKRVYIAGPYTLGDVAVNVRMAIAAGDELLAAGHWPYVPHLTHFWHMLYPRDWHDWIALDERYLLVCEAMVRLPGVSKGADHEAKLATTYGIPIFGSVESFLDWTRSAKDGEHQRHD